MISDIRNKRVDDVTVGELVDAIWASQSGGVSAFKNPVPRPVVDELVKPGPAFIRGVNCWTADDLRMFPSAVRPISISDNDLRIVLADDHNKMFYKE